MRKWIAVGLLLWPASALADPVTVLTCNINSTTVSRQCSLTPSALAGSVEDDTGRGPSGERYETEYLVSYDFPCTGTAFPPAIVFDMGERQIAVAPGVGRQAASVLGYGALRIVDQNPDLTRRMVFRGGCQLVVHSVTALPSTSTVQQWSSEAKGLARIIDLSVQRYLLAKDYLDIALWNRDKLLLLKDKLDSLVVAYPTNLHYKTMRNHVKAALENQPSSVTLAELTEAGEDVRVTLRRELDADVAQGRALVDRFQRWQQQAEATLEDVLNHIPAD
jgi:hypothetical protein